MQSERNQNKRAGDHVRRHAVYGIQHDGEQSQRFIDPLIEDEIKSYNNAAIIFEDIDKGYEITKVVFDTGEMHELSDAIHNIYYGDVLGAYYSLCSSLVCVVCETV